jgi:hypothetical protein
MHGTQASASASGNALAVRGMRLRRSAAASMGRLLALPLSVPALRSRVSIHHSLPCRTALPGTSGFPPTQTLVFQTRVQSSHARKSAGISTFCHHAIPNCYNCVVAPSLTQVSPMINVGDIIFAEARSLPHRRHRPATVCHHPARLTSCPGWISQNALVGHAVPVYVGIFSALFAAWPPVSEMRTLRRPGVRSRT